LQVVEYGLADDRFSKKKEINNYERFIQSLHFGLVRFRDEHFIDVGCCGWTRIMVVNHNA
jgi:hypothetical protein